MTRIIIAPTHDQIKNRAFQLRLWIIIYNMNHSRRGLLEDIVAKFRDYQGKIQYANGLPYRLPDDFDAVFGNDPDCRSLGHYLEAIITPNGVEPKRSTRNYRRLEVLVLYAQIVLPNAAHHLALI